MRINLHAGHCPDGGKGACGAIGNIKESTEAREVKKWTKLYLETAGVTVYDTTCDEQVDRNTCLKNIVTKCNKHEVDFDISIHFNCKDNPYPAEKDGKTTGSESWVYSTSGNQEKNAIVKRWLKAMEEKGFRNRGLKTSTSLYVLKNTKAPAILFEVCFVDDKDDTDLYKKLGANEIGRMIAEAIVDHSITTYTYMQTTGAVNMRKGAGVANEKILVIPKYERVLYLGSRKLIGDTYWYKCSYKARKGWVSGKYLKKI